MTNDKLIAVTSGEPAGIGVDLCLHLAGGDNPHRLVFIGDNDVFSARAKQLKININHLQPYRQNTTARRSIFHLPAGAKVTAGKPTPQTAGHVLQQLRFCADGCMRGDFFAMLTAPVCKAAICDGGFPFVGQTEFIAERAGVSHPVMLLAGKKMRVALATRHLPLAKVPSSLNEEDLFCTLKILNDGLKKHFVCNQKPRLVVVGLNPHAGENGHLGDEEINIIAPAVRRARQIGIFVDGPVAADTAFIKGQLPAVDCVLAMFHDQGLPVIKFADFDGTVNVTLGLPFLRASPDHGIAADLAGRGKARPQSMLAALALLSDAK